MWRIYHYLCLLLLPVTANNINLSPVLNIKITLLCLSDPACEKCQLWNSVIIGQVNYAQLSLVFHQLAYFCGLWSSCCTVSVVSAIASIDHAQRRTGPPGTCLAGWLVRRPGGLPRQMLKEGMEKRRGHRGP